MKKESEIQQQKSYILEGFAERLCMGQFLSNVNPNQSILDIRLKNMAKSKYKIGLRVLRDFLSCLYTVISSRFDLDYSPNHIGIHWQQQNTIGLQPPIYISFEG